MKVVAGIAAIVLAATALQVSAQNYPSRPVRVIIAFPPGSATDIIGRVISAKVSELWGQQAVPDNRGGAGGSIGSALTAKANPDGYTLLINSNAHVVNPSFYKTLPYNTLKDFTDIMPLVAQPNILVVTPSSKIKSVAEFITEAKASPGKINIAFAGPGSGTHLNTEKFIAAADIKVTEVPFKGTPEVVAAMLSGDVNAYWAPISAAMSLVKAGKLRPLAVSTAKRNAQLPNVPTTAEAGVQGADSPLWFGLWGPGAMPADLVKKINADVRKALADGAVKERLVAGGNDTMDMSPEQFDKLVRTEMDDYARVLKAAGVKPQ
jgi:tripartite-type tricarboxylate transporter receptor subunit TctC